MSNIIFFTDRLTDLDENVHMRFIKLSSLLFKENISSNDCQATLYVSDGTLIRVSSSNKSTFLSLKALSNEDRMVSFLHGANLRFNQFLQILYYSDKISSCIIFAPHEDYLAFSNDRNNQYFLKTQRWPILQFYKRLKISGGFKSSILFSLLYLLRFKINFYVFTNKCKTNWILDCLGFKLLPISKAWSIDRSLFKLGMHSDNRMLILGFSPMNTDYEHKRTYTDSHLENLYSPLFDLLNQQTSHFSILPHPRGIRFCNLLLSNCHNTSLTSFIFSTTEYLCYPGSLVYQLCELVDPKLIHIISDPFTRETAARLSAELELKVLYL